MALPTKREDLIALGYMFDNESICRRCGASIEWWITPNDKKLPLQIVEVKDTKKRFPQPIVRIDRIPHVNCQGE